MFDGTATVPSASEVHEAEAAFVKALSVAAVVALGLAVASCSGNGGSATSSDCQDQVRAEGTIYTSFGHIQHSAIRYSLADEAECEDVGEDAGGSVFPEHPGQVATWAFSGFAPEKVLGVRINQEWFAVLFADSVSPEERDQIYHDLATGRAGVACPSARPLGRRH